MVLLLVFIDGNLSSIFFVEKYILEFHVCVRTIFFIFKGFCMISINVFSTHIKIVIYYSIRLNGTVSFFFEKSIPFSKNRYYVFRKI